MSAPTPKIEALLSRLPDGDPQVRVQALVAEIAWLLRATSNDQNAQRLALELEASAPLLARAVATPVAHADVA